MMAGDDDEVNALSATSVWPNHSKLPLRLEASTLSSQPFVLY
jgi:hypothetical protein